MRQRSFSVQAVLTVYFGTTAHGTNVYRESLDLIEFLARPVFAMRLHERFGDDVLMEHLWTQFPRLREIPSYDYAGAMSLEQWTAQAAAALGGWKLAVKDRSS
jgi:hypothetical protein